MASVRSESVIGQVRRLYGGGTASGLSDDELLDRFVTRRDEVAFEALIERHGPMVLGVCRGVLRDAHLAEDALQSTFLALARRAPTIRARPALGGWLHRVAHSVAVRAGIDAARRRAVERRAGAIASVSRSSPARGDELRRILLEEVAQLPERLRRPVILCDLAGLTYAQAAAELGRGEATVRRRRAEAHALLRSRLERRGVVPSTMAISSALGRAGTAPPPSAVTGDVLARAAAAVSLAGRAASVPGVAPGAIGLAASAIKAGLLARSAVAAAGLVVAGMMAALAASVGAPARPVATPVTEAETPHPPGPNPQATSVPDLTEPSEPQAVPVDSVAIGGRVVDPADKPVGDALVTPNWQDHASGSRGGLDVEVRSDPDGSFSIPIPRAIYEEMGRIAELGGITLYAVAPGLAPGWGTVAATPGAPGPATIRLAADDRAIEGRIVDLEGRPVPGATVKATHGYAPKTGDLAAWVEQVRRLPQSPDSGPFGGPLLPIPFAASVETDADGRFRLVGLGAGRLAAITVSGPTIAGESIYAMSADLETVRAEVDRGIGQAAVFRYYGPGFEHAAAPTRPIEGVVRDAGTGAPIAGATIRGNLASESSFVPRPGVEASSDDRGRYRLLGLPAIDRADRYQLFIEPPEGSPYPGRGAMVAPETPAFEPLPFDIDLRRGVRVRGRVVDKGTGRPISQGWAEYFAFADNPHLGDYDGFARMQHKMAYLDEDGRFELVLLPGGGVVGARTELPGYLPGIGLEAIGHRAESIPDALNTVPFFVNAMNFQAIVEVSPEPGDGPMGLELQCDPGRAVPVRLVDPEGEPLAGVVARGIVANAFPSPQTLDSDAIEAGGVDPRRPRRAFFVHGERGLAGSLLLLGDEQGERIVRLEPWAVLTGRVVDGEGGPRGGITIEDFLPTVLPDRLEPERGDYTDWGVEVGPDGRFRIEGLVPGLCYSGSATLRRNFTIGPLFEDIVLGPGEVRDLGDLRVIAPGEGE